MKIPVVDLNSSSLMKLRNLRLATWGNACIFAEETGKILDVAEAHHVRQFLDADIRIGQELSGDFHSFAIDELLGGKSEASVVNFHNPFERADARCRLSLDRLPGWAADCLPEAACYDMEGENLSSMPIFFEDGCLTLAAPSCKAGSVIMMERAPEEELLRSLLTWPQIAGHDHLKLCLVNLDRKKRRVKLVLKAAAPLEIEPPPAEVSIAPGQNLVFKLPMKNRQQLQDFTAVEMKIDSKTVSVLVAPELCNRDFEQHASDDLRPDHWGVCDYYYKIAYRQTVECPVSTWLVGGELTKATPVSGKYALKLPGRSEPLPISTQAPPMGGPHYGGSGWPQKELSLPWYYNAGQYAILKPDTAYQFSFSVRFADGEGLLRVQAYPYTERRDVKSYLFATQEIKAQTGNQGWCRHTIDFHTPKQPLNNLKTPIWFVNRARSPLLIDDISLQETGTPDSR